jgi:hypothetical protein
MKSSSWIVCGSFCGIILRIAFFAFCVGLSLTVSPGSKFAVKPFESFAGTGRLQKI